MTTITHGSAMTSAARAAPAASLMTRVRIYFARGRAERQLDQLDDRLLADIGLRRSEIRKMVWGG